jgi:hypothetical protein
MVKHAEVILEVIMSELRLFPGGTDAEQPDTMIGIPGNSAF